MRSKSNVKKESKSASPKSGHQEIDALYAQLESIFRRTKLTKRALAEKLGMSYQGFLISYKNQNLGLDKWVAAAKFLNLPFSLEFGVTKKQEPKIAPPVEPVAKTPPASEASDLQFKMEIMYEQMQLLRRHTEILESQIKDKEAIIRLLTNR